jgi:hypothetical protein
MAEKDKGFRFRRLFSRDTEAGESQKVNDTDESSVIKSQSITSPGSISKVHDLPLVEDFVQRLQNLINQNNQPGFDFLEFTESLFEEKQNPTPEVYKTVFIIAQKIDKSLNPAKVLESSMFYKSLVQRTAETEINKGITKKQSLQSEKDTEKTTLENNLKNTRTKIQQLTRQIQELQNQDITLNNQLSAIDQKYEGQFFDIEAGIKSNIS